jgi:hypothetical protein
MQVWHAQPGVTGEPTPLYLPDNISTTCTREREARRYVNGYLLSLDDKTLAELGYDRAEIVNSDAGVAYRY